MSDKYLDRLELKRAVETFLLDRGIVVIDIFPFGGYWWVRAFCRGIEKLSDLLKEVPSEPNFIHHKSDSSVCGNSRGERPSEGEEDCPDPRACERKGEDSLCRSHGCDKRESVYY